jgi:predicted secreted hydrolase
VLVFAALVATPAPGYDLALPGYDFQFPRDHFSHPSFQVEWWYYTGNLQTPEGRSFGFELTFFRLGARASRPDARTGPEKSTVWDLDDVYLAHFAISDIAAGEFHKTERLNRAGPGLAGAELDQARIWNGNWEVRWLEPLAPGGRQKLRAVSEDFSINLDLTPAKPPVVHGAEGVSRKAAGPGRASHYISFTRLSAAGTLSLSGREFAVNGTAWMDHEFSTDSMGLDQTGWDWMSIQLDNGEELMLYRMRRKDGSADPVSSGTFVDRAGKALHLEWSDIVMEPAEPWESPRTGGRYPLRWNVAVPRLKLALECRARFANQEVVSQRELSPTYWEGAVVYEGRVGEQEVRGVGYLEMTGYDKPIELGRRKER